MMVREEISCRQSQSPAAHADMNEIATKGQKRAGTAAKSTHSPRFPWTTIASTAVEKATINAISATVAVMTRRSRPNVATDTHGIARLISDEISVTRTNVLSLGRVTRHLPYRQK
jgi:hypothetical protein